MPKHRKGARLFAQRPETEVADELEFHLEQRVQDYISRGMDPAEARRAATARLGDVSTVRRECAELLAAERRSAARRDWFGDLRQDLRFGLRSAVRAPLFSILAIVTLALGIGANTAVFGVVKSVLLDALPYADADRLVRVYGHYIAVSEERGALSAGMVTDIGERSRSFHELAAFMGSTPDVVFGGAGSGPSVAKVAWVQPRLFRVLGVQAMLGRTFRDEDVASDTARVVVAAHAAWHRLLGGDTAVVGRDVRINGIPRTVIGVLPRDFVGPSGPADFYFALDIGPVLANPVSIRRSHWLGLVGRLRPGVSHETARRQLATIGEELAVEYPDDNGSIRLRAVPLRDAMVGDTRTPLLVLLGSAGLVLLIACANLAGALLSRTITRRKEFAVRVALGAGRGRLARQLLTESTMLALAGAAVGLLLAALGLAALRELAPPALPEYADLALDRGAILVTFVLALSTGLAFGVAPALSVGRRGVESTLREEGRGASESLRSRRLRGALVAGQIALCVSLLAGAGLLARSLWAMTATPLGFETRGVLSVAVQLPPGSYRTAEARRQFHELFMERLRGIPGVVDVASTSFLPTAVFSRSGLAIVGEPPPPDDAQPFVLIQGVSDDYFRTMGIPLRRGRTYGAQDLPDAPPTVVVSEAMARRHWPGGDALGAQIRLGPDRSSTPFEVVGIVGDVRNDPSSAEAEPIAYASMRNDPWGSVYFVLRTRGDPLSMVRTVRAELAAIDPALPLDRPTTLSAFIAEGLSARRLPVMLMTAFGALALVLASVGVYALFASMVAAREREFGVRVTLGARPRSIAGLVLRQGVVWMALGLIGGAVGVVVVTRLVRGLLYAVSPFDPLALGAAVAMLVVCGALALLAPVRRATRVDPISVLR